jgi:alpha-glucosidase
MKKQYSLYIAIAFVFFSQLAFSQAKSYLIMDDIAIFYPNDFNGDAHLPSFALKSEPVKTGDIPADWKTKVHFYSNGKFSNAIIEIDESTDIYGTGEVTGPLRRNGLTRVLYNHDNARYNRNQSDLKLYQSHPWVMGVRKDGTAFGVLADNTWRQEISIGKNITFQAESAPFRVIIIEKQNPKEVIKALAQLTGTIEFPPLWSLGFQQCSWSYYPDSRVREIADTFRIKQIPCDVIWMDIHYMDAYKVFTFSPERFPNPKQTNKYLHDKGFKSVWMIDPGVKKEEGYFVYDSGTKKDVWVKTADNKDFVGRVWPGDCVFPDYTQEKVRNWWAGLYKDFMATGIDGVWNDMNEPSVFRTENYTMPDDNIHLGDDKIKKDVHLRYHNVYGMLMAKASKQGIMKANPDKRPFVLTRANFLGGQRYAATWTGDNASTWEHLKLSIPMSITLGLSGQPFNGPDIGGFALNATPELYGHWVGLGTFYPFSRAHSAINTNNHEPWSFGKEIENVARKAIERRYRLMPYLYTQFYYAATTGIPVMQPVYFADHKDRNLRKEQEAFLFGNDLLIVPKWAENPALPKGKWPTISILPEGTENDKYLPEVKIRPGAIVPMSKVIQNTTEYSLETLDLYICLDANGKAEGQLYHDAEDGYGYKKGEYALLTIEAEKQGDKVVVKVSDKEGKYKINNISTNVYLYTGEKVITGKGKLNETFSINY